MSGAGGGWRKWVVTVGGSGLSPVAPGTAGSLVTTAGLAGLYMVMGPVEGWVWNLILVGGILGFGALCVGLGSWTVAFFGRKDPGACVVDEGAGICLTALLLPIFSVGRELCVLAIVFMAFRLFDVTKPPPAKRLEKLPGGWGILVDDLAAAVYANLVCQLVVRWWM